MPRGRARTITRAQHPIRTVGARAPRTGGAMSVSFCFALPLREFRPCCETVIYLMMGKPGWKRFHPRQLQEVTLVKSESGHVNRRRFLAGLGVGTAAVALSPTEVLAARIREEAAVAATQPDRFGRMF